jgi:hypothetical protein
MLASSSLEAAANCTDGNHLDQEEPRLKPPRLRFYLSAIAWAREPS